MKTLPIRLLAGTAPQTRESHDSTRLSPPSRSIRSSARRTSSPGRRPSCSAECTARRACARRRRRIPSPENADLHLLARQADDALQERPARTALDLRLREEFGIRRCRRVRNARPNSARAPGRGSPLHNRERAAQWSVGSTPLDGMRYACSAPSEGTSAKTLSRTATMKPSTTAQSARAHLTAQECRPDLVRE